MVEKINALLPSITLDYDRDVLPLREAKGGRRRDRAASHVRAGKENDPKKAGKGQPMVDYLASIGLSLSNRRTRCSIPHTRSTSTTCSAF